MKKIITTVGTSLFTNHFEEDNASDLKLFHEDLKGISASKWDAEGIKQDREDLRQEVKKFWHSDQASAEIASLLKIADQYPNEELEVYLIATDTVLSRLAAELVQEWFEGKMTVRFDPEQQVIAGLSVEQAGTFIEHGIQRLVQTILDIRGKGEDAMLLNISGGYKGLIPVMTIVGQLYDMNICYTYEDSEELIEIPRMPLNFDWEIIEQFSSALLRPQKMKPEEGEALKVLHLATEQNEGYALTLLGNLIAQYLDRNPPHFGTQFGYFIEYKLKEYFDQQVGCQRVLHGYKPNKYDKSAPDGDVDLALLDEKGGFTAIEIKPFELLSNPVRLCGFMQKLTDRAQAMGEQKGLRPTELWLFTYSFQVERGNAKSPRLDDSQLATLSEIAAQMKKEIPGVQFSCKHVIVPRNKVTPSDRIPYKKFLGGSIKDGQIHTLFPTG